MDQRMSAMIVGLTAGLAACGGDTGSGNSLSQLTSAVSQMEKMTKGMAAAADRNRSRRSVSKCSSTTCQRAWTA